MAEIKEKVITVETLAVLHEHNKQTYMPKTNPVGEGTMTMNGNMNVTGNTNISGDVVVGSLMIGANVKLVPTGDALEIVFVND